MHHVEINLRIVVYSPLCSRRHQLLFLPGLFPAPAQHPRTAGALVLFKMQQKYAGRFDDVRGFALRYDQSGQRWKTRGWNTWFLNTRVFSKHANKTRGFKTCEVHVAFCILGKKCCRCRYLKCLHAGMQPDLVLDDRGKIDRFKKVRKFHGLILAWMFNLSWKMFLRLSRKKASSSKSRIKLFPPQIRN